MQGAGTKRRALLNTLAARARREQQNKLTQTLGGARGAPRRAATHVQARALDLSGWESISRTASLFNGRLDTLVRTLSYIASSLRRTQMCGFQALWYGSWVIQKTVKATIGELAKLARKIGRGRLKRFHCFWESMHFCNCGDFGCSQATTKASIKVAVLESNEGRRYNICPAGAPAVDQHQRTHRTTFSSERRPERFALQPSRDCVIVAYVATATTIEGFSSARTNISCGRYRQDDSLDHGSHGGWLDYRGVQRGPPAAEPSPRWQRSLL